MASTDARPVPRKNTAFRVTFPIMDADGDLVTGATGLDSEVSIDGGTFADVTAEATEIATSSGIYFLDLTAAEMNGDTVAVIVKTTSSGGKTTTLVFYPEEIGDYRADVVQISGDTTAADNAEAFFDGTGYAGTNNVIPTVTTVGTLTTYTGNTPQTGDSFAIVNSGTHGNSALKTLIDTLDNIVDTEVGAIKTVTDQFVFTVANRVDSTAQSGLSTLSAADVRTAVGLASANLDTQLVAIAGFIDAEVASILAAVDTEVAAIKAKTDQFVFTVANRVDSTAQSGLSTLTTGDIDARLAAYDGPTNAEMEARTIVAANYATATALDTVDNLIDTELQAVFDRLGAPAGASVSADIAAMLAALPRRIKKNTALAAFPFLMVDSTDHVTAETGLTITATRSIDGGAFGACTNAAAEISAGLYKIDLAAADLNGTTITLKFASVGADTRIITLVTQE